MATLASRLPKASSLSLDTRLREERYLQRRTSPLGQDGGRSPAAGTGKLDRNPSSQNNINRSIKPDSSNDKLEGQDDYSEGRASKANTAASSPIVTRSSTFSDTSQPAISRPGLLKRHSTINTNTGTLAEPKQEKKKAVSFISRFLTTNKKRTWTLTNTNERTSIDEVPSPRTLSRVQSMEYSELIDNIEFAPRILQPQGYAKVRSKNKRVREFDKLFLAQELRIDDGAANATRLEKPDIPDQNAIWAMAFSRDGKFLAAAGQNHLVKVWCVLTSLEEREADCEENEAPTSRMHLRAAVFKTDPVRTFTDHNGPVLDLSWSKNNFLLTTSQDKTVRLFHPTRAECLCTFKHASQVHSVAFHPHDDRFFLAGCKDAKLRLWSIPDKKVAFAANVSDMVTAVTFAPDGKTCMAGTMTGNISIYHTENLKYSCSFLARGKKKCRITSIEAKHVPNGSDAIKILVTTADSRIQLYNMRDKGLEIKIKGHKNEEGAMNASFNEDGRYIICGSEDKSVYVWSLTDENNLPDADKNRDKTIQRPVEFFEANLAKTTCAVFAPKETRVILNNSGDPIYEICNPPPVKLVERADSISSDKWNRSNVSLNGTNDQRNAPKSVPNDTSPALSPPTTADNALHTMTSSAVLSEDSTKNTPYSVRAAHPTGHIIVTASTSGIIRIFRQDCAYVKRSRFLDADPSARRLALRRAFTGATQSSRSSMSMPRSARPVSIRSVKDTPAPSIHEQRQSITMGNGELVTRTKRGESNASQQQPTRDRIERWRDDIDGVVDSSSSLRRTGSMHSATSASMVTANESPVKPRTPHRSSMASAASGALRTRADSGDTSHSIGIISSFSGRPTSAESPNRPGLSVPGDDSGVDTRSSSYADPLRMRNGQSFMFYNISNYVDPKDHLTTDRPAASSRLSRQSVVSRLTSEESLDRFEAEPEEEDDDDDDEFIQLRARGKCPRCAGTEFTTKESRAWGFGKIRSLVCNQCGLERKNSGGA